MEYAELTIEEIHQLETKYNRELLEECNELMESGEEEKIEEGFRVQYGRFCVRDFLTKLKVFAHNKKNTRDFVPAASKTEIVSK